MRALGNNFGEQLPKAPARARPGFWGWSRSPPPRRSCTYADPRDLVIVIDSSGSVGREAFDQTVAALADFIGYMCHNFECGGPETRFALVTYSSTVKEVFNFQYSGTYHRTSTQIVHDIKTKASYMSGWTATGTALEHCRDKIFRTHAGMRSNSKRQILLLTDGRSNRGTSPGLVATELHDHLGVDIYALGIGSGVNIAELQAITKERSPINLLYLALFNDFHEFFRVGGIVKSDLDRSGRKCKAATKIYDKKK
jgi:uncharacterized protein YegL